MRRQTRDRLVLPVLLPVGILVLMALSLYGFSRVLLSLSHDGATATALLVALTIVVMSAVVAGRRFVRLSSLMGMVGAVAGVAMIAGGVAVATIGGEGGEGGGGKVTTIDLVAVNIAFQQTQLTVPAGEPFKIVFHNQDAGVQHNVQIFDNTDYTGAPLFKGELATGPTTITYDVPALDPGTYGFDCVVHPNMQGTIEAVEGGGGGGGGGGGASVTVSAQSLAFDTDTIELPANAPATITFENKDAGIQHNIAIYQDDTLAQNLFRGELVTGPATAEYQIPPLPPGTYYFRCDVHPNMNGKVVVGGGGGTGATGPTPAPSGGATASMSPMMSSMSPMMGSPSPTPGP